MEPTKRPFSQLFAEIGHFLQNLTMFKLMVDNTEESYHIELFLQVQAGMQLLENM